MWSLGAFILSFVVLAPLECVGYCEDFEAAAGVDGRCLSSCTTLLGHSAPLGSGWFLAPCLLVGLLLVTFRTRRGSRSRSRGTREGQMPSSEDH